MNFETATLHDLETLIHWAGGEGWNPGTEDAGPFYDTDPEGFFVAKVGGRMSAGISVVNHSDAFAFLGLYICHLDFRGTGVAHGLWKHAIAHAGERTIGLDGVPAEQETYRRSGFEHAGETYRYAGMISPRSLDGMRMMAFADLEAVTALDGAANGFLKPGFLESWTTESTGRRTIVQENGGRIIGFATVRRCLKGIKIGPLVAERQEDAEALLHAAAGLFPDQPAMIDIPDHSPALAEYCRAIGLDIVFNTARMYRGLPPRPGPHPCAVATLELG